MPYSDERALVILVVGAAVGYLAGKLFRGAGLGLVGDGAVGIVGALIGDWLLPRFHIHLMGGLAGLAVDAALGAVVATLLLRLAGGGGSGR